MQQEQDTIYKYEISLSTLNSSQAQINSQKTLDFLLQPILLQFNETVLSWLNYQLRHALRQEEVVFQNRQLFVLFEKELGCDPRTDHLVQKNVYPLYKAYFEQIFKTLYNKLQISLQSECAQLSERVRAKLQAQMGDIIDMADSFSLAFAMSCKETVDMVHLLERVYLLSVDEKIRLRREIYLLKEQLVTKHRIETLYTSDGESSDVLKRRLKNITQVTTNYLMDEIVSLSYEKRAAETYMRNAILTNERNAVYIYKLYKLKDEQEKVIASYKEQMDELIAQIAELRFQAYNRISDEEAVFSKRNTDTDSAKNVVAAQLGLSTKDLEDSGVSASEDLANDILKHFTGENVRSDVETEIPGKIKSVVHGLADRIQNFKIRDKVLQLDDEKAAVYYLIECINQLDQLASFQEYVGAKYDAIAASYGMKLPQAVGAAPDWATSHSKESVDAMAKANTLFNAQKRAKRSQEAANAQEDYQFGKVAAAQKDREASYTDAEFRLQPQNQFTTTRGVGVQVSDGRDCGIDISLERSVYLKTDLDKTQGKLQIKGGNVYVSGRRIDLKHIAHPTYEDKNSNKIDITDWHVNERDQLADYYGCRMTDSAHIMNQWGDEVRDYAGFLAKKGHTVAYAKQKVGELLEKMQIGVAQSDPMLTGLFAHIQRTLERRRAKIEQWRNYEIHIARQALGGSGGLTGTCGDRSSILSMGERQARDYTISRNFSALEVSNSNSCGFSQHRFDNELLAVKCSIANAQYTRKSLDFMLDSGSQEGQAVYAFPKRVLFASQIK